MCATFPALVSVLRQICFMCVGVLTPELIYTETGKKDANSALSDVFLFTLTMARCCPECLSQASSVRGLLVSPGCNMMIWTSDILM